MYAMCALLLQGGVDPPKKSIDDHFAYKSPGCRIKSWTIHSIKSYVVHSKYKLIRSVMSTVVSLPIWSGIIALPTRTECLKTVFASDHESATKSAICLCILCVSYTTNEKVFQHNSLRRKTKARWEMYVRSIFVVRG